MHVVIVESGAKAKTIQKHLTSLFPGQSFQVIACFGHIRDLPEKEIGVNTTTWDVTYVDSDKKGVITRLKQAVKEASKIYLASDPDREGEAIAFHLKERLGLKQKTYQRVTFHEITKDAISRAFQSPRDIDMPLVEAQETRRILDRIVGYELSPLLWRRYCTSNLSAGRVQSTALQMIVQRAKDAQSHQAETFWNISADFVKDIDITLTSALYFENEEARWPTLDEAKKVFDYVRKLSNEWKVYITKKVSKKSPSPPFITTTLQKEAYELHKIPGKQVMSLAQKLYESGYITYMRTDSPSISEMAREEALAYIRNNVGPSFAQERMYKTKSDHSQEAHECIRPSYMETTSDQLRADEELTASHIKIYDLIWRRAVASQMVDAEYNEYEYTIRHSKWGDGHYYFQGKSRVLVKLGFLKVYTPKTKVESKELAVWEREGNASSITQKELRCSGEATRGVGLYNEPSIVKAMEKAGIGRPSTYASIIEKLFTKKYVEHGTNPQCDIEVQDYIWDGKETKQAVRTIHLGGSEKDRFVPTSLGYRVVEYIAETYPDLLDLQFTSKMETELDEISQGKYGKTQSLDTFYAGFHASIEKQMQSLATAPKKEKGQGEQRMKVIRSWDTMQCNLVETKFGVALYHLKKKKFTSITPFLQWKGKQIEQVSDDEVAFLLSFPKKVQGNAKRTVEIGPYGFYVKEDKKNIPLPKELWGALEQGTLTAAQLNAVTWTKKPRPFEAPAAQQ